MRIQRGYDGSLKEGDMYEGKADGNRVRISKIHQNTINKVWTADLVYTHSHTKEGSVLPMACFDFEALLKRGQFRKIN